MTYLTARQERILREAVAYGLAVTAARHRLQARGERLAGPVTARRQCVHARCADGAVWEVATCDPVGAAVAVVVCSRHLADTLHRVTSPDLSESLTATVRPVARR